MPQSALKHFKWKEIELEHLNPLFDRQMVVGESIMLARIILKKGAYVPMHHHHNEQLTYCLEGGMKFGIDGREIELRPGDGLCIPPNMPHEAWALDDTIELDVFVPPRADWLAKDDAYLRGKGTK
jgi:quercetin dioxygenase-like cupin family protein